MQFLQHCLPVCTLLLSLLDVSFLRSVEGFSVYLPVKTNINADSVLRDGLQSLSTFSLYSSSTDEETVELEEDDSDEEVVTDPRVDDIKLSLIQECEKSKNPDGNTIKNLVEKLEDMGEQCGIGQGSSYSGLLAGKWSLIYASEDDTRSSPFFWAFRKAFPDKANQIYSITDAIPAPIKEVGPAIQTISLENDNSFKSEVKVATLGGKATSIMTTECDILGMESLDLMRLRIKSTTPKQSTILKTLGPFGDIVEQFELNKFPSGDALERVKAGSSEVLVQSTFCDDTLRIARNPDDKDKNFYVWVRETFEGVEF